MCRNNLLKESKCVSDHIVQIIVQYNSQVGCKHFHKRLFYTDENSFLFFVVMAEMEFFFISILITSSSKFKDIKFHTYAQLFSEFGSDYYEIDYFFREYLYSDAVLRLTINDFNNKYTINSCELFVGRLANQFILYLSQIEMCIPLNKNKQGFLD